MSSQTQKGLKLTIHSTQVSKYLLVKLRIKSLKSIVLFAQLEDTGTKEISICLW